jgi:hypothetical protein
MHTFLSLSSPHLGSKGGGSKIVDAAIWFFKALRRTTSLKQLTLDDSPYTHQKVLYMLAHSEGLAWFKSVILVASKEDTYSPQDSSRMEFQGDAGYIQDMADSLVHQLRQVDFVVKLNVNFVPSSSGGFDSYIGRKAHIQLLENIEFIQMISYRYSKVFK